MAQDTYSSTLVHNLPTVAAVLHFSLSHIAPSIHPNIHALLGLNLNRTAHEDSPSTSPTSLHTTTPTSNSLGSTLFIAYILLALYFTYRVLRVLESRFDRSWSLLSSHRKRAVTIFFALALVSFASLSWHMLGFLITHYQESQRLYRQRGVLDAVLGRRDEVGLMALLGRIWYWTTHSALFTDFARSLCVDGREGSGFWWAKQDLAGTLSSYLFVNVARGLSGDEMGDDAEVDAGEKIVIWPFIALAQILPISFSLNLFLVYLMLSEHCPDSTPNGGANGGVSSNAGSGAATTLTAAGASILLHVIYCQVLDIFPVVGDDTALIGLVMVTRVLLLLAASIPVPRTAAVALCDYLEALMAFGPVVAIALSLLEAGYRNTRHNHAVETLRYDFVIWTVSVNIWYWTRRVQATTMQEVGKRNE